MMRGSFGRPPIIIEREIKGREREREKYWRKGESEEKVRKRECYFRHPFHISSGGGIKKRKKGGKKL